jgi:hypothetical protein
VTAPATEAKAMVAIISLAETVVEEVVIKQPATIHDELVKHILFLKLQIHARDLII